MSIQTEFEQLSVEQKVQVVQDLWDRITMSPDQLPIPDWHRKELNRRQEEWANNPDPGENWDDIKHSLRDSL